MSAPDLQRIGVCDEIIPEVKGGVQRDIDFTARKLKTAIGKWLAELKPMKVDKLMERRYEKYRRIGVFMEGSGSAAPKAKVKRGSGRNKVQR